MTNKQQLGKYGEDLAVQYYQSQGYQLVSRNYYCPAGEIDVVCSKDGKLYFIEVKTRSGHTYGEPEESITPKKRERIYACAQHFLTTQEKYSLSQFRFHVCVLMCGVSQDIIRIYTEL